jgi:hypothetical protein
LVRTVALCGLLLLAGTTVAAGPGVLVKLNVAEAAPGTDAVTVNEPVLELALKRVETVAIPPPVVTAVVVPRPPKLPLADAPGLTVKVTVTEGAGLLPESVTMTDKANGNVVDMAVL